MRHPRSVGRRTGDQELPLKLLTPYAVSKIQAEDAIRRMADSAFSPIFLRNAPAYGMSSRLRLDFVLNNLVVWAWTT